MRKILFLVFLSITNDGSAAGAGGSRCTKNSECETKVCRSDKTCHPCPDRNNCPPPGTCAEHDNKSLKAAKDAACNVERSCIAAAKFDEKKADCSELKKRVERGNKCLAARDTVMSRCYKGGDDNHRRVRAEYADVRKHCQELLNYKQKKKLCR